MALKMTLWAFGLLFVATIWNVISSYAAMNSVDVQNRFHTMGLLGGDIAAAELPLPTQKALVMTGRIASAQ